MQTMSDLGQLIAHRKERRKNFRDKFAISDDSGAYVMKTDAMHNRFTNEHTKESVRIRILIDTVIEDTPYGKRELAQDNRMLVQAHTLLRLGFKAPTKRLCKVYPDALEKWTESRIKIMRSPLWRGMLEL